MFKHKLFKEFIALSIVLAVLNKIALKNSWYWSLDQFDVLMHFLGGAVVGMFFTWIYFYSGLFSPVSRSRNNFIMVAVLGIILVGVSWESFELIGKLTSVSDNNYALDTIKDIIMDTLGSITACLYAYYREQKEKTWPN